MRTGLKILSSVSVFLILPLGSCKPHSVEKDMDDWCACRQQAKSDISMEDKCLEMMQQISDKYEFDPEAITIIEKKALECKQ